MKRFLILILLPGICLSQSITWMDSVYRNYRDYGHGAITFSDGTGYFAGSFGGYSFRMGDTTSSGIFLRKYSGDGNMNWEKFYHSTCNVYCTGVAHDSERNIYLSIYTTGYANEVIEIDSKFYDANCMMYLLKINPNGEIRWIRSVRANPNDVHVDNQDNVYIAGTSSLTGFVTKYDSEGNHKLTIPIKSGMQVSTDTMGNIYCIEKKYSSSSPFGINMLKKFTRNGILLWTIQLPADVDMTCDPSGNVYLIEFAMFGNAPITKLSGEGQVLWKNSTSLSAGGQLRMTLNETGDLYATGMQRENGSILACFDQTGATTWTLAVPYRYEPSQIGVNGNNLVVAATKKGVQKKIAYVLHFTLPGSPLTDIQELKNTIFTVFPNPSPQVFTISYCGTSTEPAELFLYDMSGKCVMCKISPPGEFKETLDLRDLTKGIYLLELVHGQEKQCRKLVLE